FASKVTYVSAETFSPYVFRKKRLYKRSFVLLNSVYFLVTPLTIIALSIFTTFPYKYSIKCLLNFTCNAEPTNNKRITNPQKYKLYCQFVIKYHSVPKNAALYLSIK